MGANGCKHCDSVMDGLLQAELHRYFSPWYGMGFAAKLRGDEFLSPVLLG
jgi:hypothetical protein